MGRRPLTYLDREYLMLDVGISSQALINGTRLTVQETGEGVPVVFVHGAVSDMRTWAHQITPFSQRYKTIAYSRRYHMPNAMISPDQQDPIQTQIDDLIGLIETRGSGAAHIVGHSWGGLMTLMLMMQRPDLVRSAILIEPPALSLHVNVPPKVTEMISMLFRNPRLAIAIAKLGGGLSAAEKMFRKGDDREAVEVFSRVVLGDTWHDALTPARAAQIWENRGPGRALALNAGFPSLKGAYLGEIKTPVLLVAGAQTPDVSLLINKDLCARLPNARSAVVSGASHIVHEDNWQDFNEIVLRFLEDVA